MGEGATILSHFSKHANQIFTTARASKPFEASGALTWVVSSSFLFTTPKPSQLFFFSKDIRSVHPRIFQVGIFQVGESAASHGCVCCSLTYILLLAVDEMLSSWDQSDRTAAAVYKLAVASCFQRGDTPACSSASLSSLIDPITLGPTESFSKCFFF